MSKQKEVLILFSIILIGFCLRLFLVLDLPIWLDEAFTINHIKLSFLELINGQFDPTHPFGYYLFLKFWSIFSTNLQWLRASTLIFYLINSVLLYQIALVAKQKNLAYFLVILYALSGYFLIFDWQARMYAGALTLMLTSWYFLQKRKNLLFVLVNAIGLYFDYAFLWYLIPLTLFIFYQLIKKHKQAKQFVLGTIFSWLAFAFWIPTFLFTYKDGIEAISWSSRFTNPTFFLPYFLGSHVNAFITVLFFVFSLIGIFISFKNDKRFAKFFIGAGLFSGLLAFITSFFVGSIFHVRNLQIMALMFLIALAVCLGWLWKQKHQYLVLIFLSIYFFNFLLTMQTHYIFPSSLLLKF